MKIVLVFVATLDGKVTRWEDPFVRKWSSEADQKYFSGIWKNSELIVMGSSTFNADPPKPSKKSLLIVMTHQPAKYKESEVPGHIEFTDESPSRLASRFEQEGYEQMVVVGGPHVATSFFKEDLPDELWLTVEPRIFGSGDSFVIKEKMDVKLQLLSYEKVNELGTLILKYAILNN